MNLGPGVKRPDITHATGSQSGLIAQPRDMGANAAAGRTRKRSPKDLADTVAPGARNASTTTIRSLADLELTSCSPTPGDAKTVSASARNPEKPHPAERKLARGTRIMDQLISTLSESSHSPSEER